MKNQFYSLRLNFSRTYFSFVVKFFGIKIFKSTKWSPFLSLLGMKNPSFYILGLKLTSEPGGMLTIYVLPYIVLTSF